jgi:hypothetical protein
MVLRKKIVMAGLVPAIYVFRADMFKSWMPGARPGMTVNNVDLTKL